MNGGAKTCILGGRMKTHCLAQEVVIQPFHSPGRICLGCVFNSAFSLPSLCLSFLSSPSYLPLGLCQQPWPVVAFCGTPHPFSTLQRYMCRGLCLFFMYGVSTTSYQDLNCFEASIQTLIFMNLFFIATACVEWSIDKLFRQYTVDHIYGHIHPETLDQKIKVVCEKCYDYCFSIKTSVE